VAAIAAAYLLWREDTPLRVPLAWTGGAAILAVSAAAILGNDAGALTVAGVYLCLAGTGGSKTRAAGAIVLTMAAQAYWAPLGLTPFVEPILRFDTVLAGSLVALTIPGAGWQGTLISTPGGFSLQVAPGCSSVHNIALAVLCWMAFSRLERARWRLADLAVLAVVVACQLAANVARLYVISLSQPLYQFWHEGVGKHAFASLATMAAVVLSVVGTRWIDFRWPESRRPAIGPKASMAVGGA
jgi:exosortase/archaeosortase family protein